jgi:hypothetical protein
MSDREIMNSKSVDKVVTMKFRDPVVRRVCEKFTQRSDEGFAKYGRTLHAERTGGHKDLLEYLNDVQEELMDAILYIQTARELIDEAVGTQDNS